MRGTIVIDENRCKGCSLCTTVCPKEIIHIADCITPRGYHPAHLVDPQNLCTGCLLCSTICPDTAITVYRESARKQSAAALVS
ncbi:MAG: ferredoxin family protein [Chloroflexi bacterium]|uniref:Ferredoxin family protein n=1 Tax=Candidatus Chlorohelix allophototropha TaxID=3003348 RepID=A0A8T7LY84_9CHLR|nr:ferredoxin family protein [Chloroflexota bacterium]WJW67741.1 ferredoxin family protein [Chloroflexota bacterium L227-S17]